MNLKIFRPCAPSPVAALAPAGLYKAAFADDKIEPPEPAFGSRQAHRELQTNEEQRSGPEQGKACELCG